MSKWDVLIIGSGISSLTAAAILAKKGKSVCVLEQHVKPGGYLHCFNRFGLRYDTGSHYVGSMKPGQTFHTLLSYLGAYDPSFFLELDADGFDHFKFPEFQTAFPVGYPALIQRLSEQFPSEKAAIQSYFSLIESTVQQFPTYAFRPEFDESVVAKALEQSVKSVVESLTSHRPLQAVFYAYCAIHGVLPEDMPLGLHALVTDSMVTGPYGFRRGGDPLTQKFVEVITKAGGKVITKARVQKLLVEDKTVTQVVLTNGESFSAEWVLSGIHPKSTFRMLEPCDLKPAFLSRLNKLKESEGIFGIYAYSEHRPTLAPKKNYYYFKSENPEVFLHSGSPYEMPGMVFLARTHRDEIGEEEVPGKFPLTFHSAGPIRWFEKWNTTQFNRRPGEYQKFKDGIASQVFKLVDQYETGLSPTIIKYESSTALSNLHFNGSEEGSAYGVYHSFENTGWRALGPRTHLKNLLLTGQSTLCPGLLGAAISGLRTAGNIVGLKPLLKDLAEFRGNV